jgi:predicted phage-related endonuclease
MSKIELTTKVRELKELKIMAEELAAEITAIEDVIKAEMTVLDTEEMVVDIFKIRWTKVTSNRFDSGAFKKTHADLYTQYTKAVESRRFSVA